MITDSNTIGGTFFANMDATVQSLITYIENSVISGKVFDISNGDEFENNALYVDNVTSGGSFFSASNTNIKTLSVPFNNNNIGGDGSRTSGTFNSTGISISNCEILGEFIK